MELNGPLSFDVDRRIMRHQLHNKALCAGSEAILTSRSFRTFEFELEFELEFEFEFELRIEIFSNSPGSLSILITRSKTNY